MTHADLLKLHALKATPQRLCVLNTLEKTGHSTLEEIQTLTKENFPTPSLSTIYRNLNELVGKGILTEVKVANKKDYFEITKDFHAHLVCNKCGKIEDIKIDPENIINQAKQQSKSKILNTTISFESTCKECLNSK